METSVKLNANDYVGQAGIEPEIIEALNEQRRKQGRECVTETTDGVVILESEAVVCERCEVTVHEDDSRGIHSDGQVVRWCEVCTNHHSFTCDSSGETFCNDSYTQAYVEGETVCQEWNQDELYYWESDEEWHWESEPEEDEDGVPEYHCANRPWKHETPKPLALGCELECWSSDRRATYERATSLGLTGEQDGSLDSAHGIEIIGAPMPLADYATQNNPWRQFCERSTVRCWEADGNYGQHVSINVNGESQLAIAKSIVFVHHNRTLCELVAGRGANTYNVYKDVQVKNAGRESRDKYCATNWNVNQGRLEFRIFRANRNWSGFVKNVEFTHAVFNYAKDESARKLNSINFLNYIDSNPLRLKEGSYTNLRQFLRDDAKDNKRYWIKEGK